MPPKRKSQKKKEPKAEPKAGPKADDKIEAKKSSFFTKLVKYGVPITAIIFLAVSAVGYSTLNKYTNALNDAFSSRFGDEVDDSLMKKIEALIVRNNSNGIVIDKDTLEKGTLDTFLKSRNGKKFLDGIMKIANSELLRIAAISGIPDIMMNNQLISNVMQSMLENIVEYIVELYVSSQDTVLDNYYENEARERTLLQANDLLANADSSLISGYQWPDTNN